MSRKVVALSLMSLLVAVGLLSAQPSFPQGTGSMRGDRGFSGPTYYPPVYSPAPQYESGYYGARPEFVVPRDAALINMEVPANAEVWFSGEKTKSDGLARSFVTPSLERGKKFAYEVRVRWMDKDGKAVEKVEKVPVRPGDRLSLRFN